MSISRYKRARRKSLAALRRVKCGRHRVPACEDRNCRYEVAAAFYGRHKKRKGGGLVEVSYSDLDRLFRIIKYPHLVEELPRDFDPAPEPVPASPQARPIAPTGNVDTRQLTLRQRIALGVSASA
jgi:hypothetical protein